MSHDYSADVITTKIFWRNNHNDSVNYFDLTSYMKRMWISSLYTTTAYKFELYKVVFICLYFTLSNLCMFITTETWRHYCSSGWGLVCNKWLNGSITCFCAHIDIEWPLFVILCFIYMHTNMCICIYFEIVRFSCLFFAVCFQDQHMKLLLKSYIKLLKIINASTSQSCLVLTSQLTTMLVM